MSVFDRLVRKDFSVEKTFELRSEEPDVFKSWGIACKGPEAGKYLDTKTKAR